MHVSVDLLLELFEIGLPDLLAHNGAALQKQLGFLTLVRPVQDEVRPKR